MTNPETAASWTVDLAGPRPSGRRGAAHRTAGIAEWIAATTPFSVPLSNPEALRAYYAGVFSLVPLVGPLFAGGALTWGPLGVRAAGRGGGGGAHARAGVALGALSLAAHTAATVWLALL
jgi:hypothetical protein